VFDALIAWAVAGGGMFTLARVFQSLAQQKPDLDAGVDALVAAGFRSKPDHPGSGEGPPP
jgi:arginine:ornithine antiporter/lysine permease